MNARISVALSANGIDVVTRLAALVLKVIFWQSVTVPKGWRVATPNNIPSKPNEYMEL